MATSSRLIETTDNGKKVSPKLPQHIKNFLIDIDGTICDDIPNEEPWRMADAEVFPEALEKLNTWYGEGHIITFFTSRTEEHRAVTEAWLKKRLPIPRHADGQAPRRQLPLDRRPRGARHALRRTFHGSGGEASHRSGF